MKKLFLLFALMAGAVIGPQMMADELKLSGVGIVISSDQADISVTGKTQGTISWSASRKTLTFKDVVMNTGDNTCVLFTGDHITLAFEGKNVLKSNHNCFEMNVSNYCDVKSANEYGPHAYLELESTPRGETSYACIYMYKGAGALSIESIFLKATSGRGIAIAGNTSNENKLHIKTAWADIKSQMSQFAAVARFVSCTVEGGSYLKEGTYDTSHHSFFNGSTSMGEVHILPELTVGGVIVNTEMGSEDGALPVYTKGLTSGNITWNRSDNSLNFNKVVGTIGDANLPYPYGTALVANYKVDGLQVLVNGTNTITAPTTTDGKNKLGIYSDEKIYIYGATKWGDIAANKLTLNGYDAGVQSWKDLSIGHLTLIAKGEAPIFSYGKLEFNYANVTATETTAQQTGTAIETWTSLALGSCDVVGGYPEGKNIYGKDGKVMHAVTIKAFRNNKIPYIVLGRVLNEANITDFAAKGWGGGTISFNATSRKLTMKNVSISASEANPDVVGIDYSLATAMAGDQLCFEGNNRIVTGNKPALRVAAGEVELSTSNNVLLASAKNVGCYIESHDRLVLGGGEITIAGYTGGVKGDANSRLILMKGDNSAYTIASADIFDEDEATTPYPAFNVGTLVNADGMGFDFDANLGQYDAAYLSDDQKQPLKNGGDFARMVRLKPVTKWYGLTVAGIQVNDVNRYGMAGKAFTKEGSTQAYYNPSTGALMLDNAYIDMKAAGIAANAIELNRYGDEVSHSLVLKGENYVGCMLGYHGLYTLSDAVISSVTKDFKSSLEIHGNAGDGKGINPENLTIKDRAYVKLTGIKGIGIGNPEYPNRANLTVDDATLDVNMNAIKQIKSLTLKNCSIVYPEGGYFDSEQGAVVDADGKISATVQIRSANDNVTPPMGELAIDEKNFPDYTFRNYVAKNLDPDKNGYLSDEELDAVKLINLTGIRFAFNGPGVKGIGYFTSLKYLVCDNCGLSSLDLSNNEQLEQLSAPGNEFYSGLDLSQNVLLTNLYCSKSKLSKLDLSANTKINIVDCSDNQLTELDLSNNSSLSSLKIFRNKIRGEAMSKLVNSLRTLEKSDLTNLFVCENEGATGNQITRAQAAIAEAKNWNLSVDKYTESGDVNGDGVVDVADIATVISVMSSSSGTAHPLYQAADVNGDGTVDVADIASVISIMADK